MNRENEFLLGKIDYDNLFILIGPYGGLGSTSVKLDKIEQTTWNAPDRGFD